MYDIREVFAEVKSSEPKDVANDLIVQMFGKPKEEMTLGELLEALSITANLAGEQEIEEAANYTLGVAIRNGDADKTKEEFHGRKGNQFGN